jgi:hypothetical protein
LDTQSRCAFIIAQAACASATIAAMQAANQERLASGHTIAYDEAAFLAVPDQFLIGHNAVIDYLR